MKILFIIPIYIGDKNKFKNLVFTGGGARYPLELAKAFQRTFPEDNVEVMLFSSSNTTFTSENIKISLIRSTNFFTKYNGYYNPIPISLDFFKKIKSADVIHSFQMRTEASLMASLFAKLVKRKFFLTDTNFSGVSISRIIHPEYFSTGVLAISKEDYDSWNHKSKYIIYGGININQFKYKSVKKKYALYFGRIVSHKGVDVLINALDDEKVIIAGSSIDSQYLLYLRKISKNKNVEFIINPSDQKMINLYRDASCVVLPATSIDYLGKKWSRAGLYALVIPESMSCGTPVIVSNVGALPDFIETGRLINGYVFQDRNVVDLRNKIRKILFNPKLRNKMSINCRRLVEEKYDWNVIARKVKKIYIS